jgi:eukaryotic-like serine/threonine-protein kinase
MSGERTELERQALSRLDELLLLPESERAAALEAMAALEPALVAELRALLAVAPATTYAFAGAVGRAAEGFSDEQALAARPQVLGDYQVLELIGRGGMGEVYRGERADGQFQQRVAIKLLKRGMDSEEILRRFLRERQILALLTHPGVARLLDGGIAPDGRPYFVLEEVQGVPVTEYVERAKAPLGERLALFLEICDAVESAHQRLIVHRDLKPSNILVTDDGRVKLLDFGIAKVLGETGEPELTHTQLRIMTPAYAAPEQILGEPATTATDVYSLGVVLYELLTGRRPHERPTTSPSALLAALRVEKIERPSLVAARDGGGRRHRELAGDLDTIVLTALEPSLARRYPTVAAFSQDLRRYLAGRPIAARPATWRYQTGKFLRRHRVGVASAALALTALVVGLGVSLWQGDRARRAAVRAERTQAFLVSLFRSGDPWEGGAESLTVGQMLDAAVPRLETGLAGEPEVRAALEDALAQIYNRLGRLDTAAELAGRALEQRRRRFGADAVETGWSRVTRAEIEFARGEPEAALATLDAVPATLTDPDLVEAEELLRFLELRASALEQAGRSEEARVETERVMPRFLARFGPNHPDLGRLYALHGSHLANVGRLAEAEVSLTRALALRDKHLPPDHPWSVGIRMQLADLLDSLMRSTEALAMFESALAAQRRTLGPEHPLLAQTLIRYGFSLTNRGRLRESNAAYREALAIFERHDHYDAGAVLRYLGFNQVAEHRWQEGGESFFRAEEFLAGKFAAEHPMRLAAASSAGLALVKTGQLDLAVERLTRVLADLERIDGPTANTLRGPLSYLGEAERYRGRIAEALVLHRRQRDLAVAITGNEVSMPVAQADFQIALDLLAAEPPDLTEASRRLAASCAFVGKEAPESPRFGECLLITSQVSLLRGKRARAEREAADALAWVRQRYALGDPFLRDAEEVVARVHRNQTAGPIPAWAPAVARR